MTPEQKIEKLKVAAQMQWQMVEHLEAIQRTLASVGYLEMKVMNKLYDQLDVDLRSLRIALGVEIGRTILGDDVRQKDDSPPLADR